MTEKKEGSVTYQGPVPDDDPMYQGGWNFLLGSNLKQPPEEKPKSPGSAKVKHGTSSGKRLNPSMSLAEREELGIPTDPVLIISPVPRPEPKRKPKLKTPPTKK